MGGDKWKAQMKKREEKLRKEEKLKLAFGSFTKLDGHCQYCAVPLPKPNDRLPIYLKDPYNGNRQRQATRKEISNTCASCWYSEKVCAGCGVGWPRGWPPKEWEGIYSRVGGGGKKYCRNCVDSCYFCKTKVRYSINDNTVCDCE